MCVGPTGTAAIKCCHVGSWQKALAMDGAQQRAPDQLHCCTALTEFPCAVSLVTTCFDSDFWLPLRRLRSPPRAREPMRLGVAFRCAASVACWRGAWCQQQAS